MSHPLTLINDIVEILRSRLGVTPSAEGEVQVVTALVERVQEIPVPMLLFCPACNEPHVDAPDLAVGWLNPPHRTHRCGKCGHDWRPSDHCTVGVAALQTHGQDDGYAVPSFADEERRELRWVRGVIAEAFGYDGPFGDGCCPLREWLATPNMTRVAQPLERIAAALEKLAEPLPPEIALAVPAVDFPSPMATLDGARWVAEALGILDQLRAVLCDLDHTVIIDGSDGDRREVTMALHRLHRLTTQCPVVISSSDSMGSEATEAAIRALRQRTLLDAAEHLRSLRDTCLSGPGAGAVLVRLAERAANGEPLTPTQPTGGKE